MNNFIVALLKSLFAVVVAFAALYLGLSFFNAAMTRAPAIGFGFIFPLALGVPFFVYLFIPVSLLIGTALAIAHSFERGHSLWWLPFFIVPIIGPLTIYYYKGSPTARPRKTNSFIRIAVWTLVIVPASVTNAFVYLEAGKLLDFMTRHPLPL